MRRWISLMLVIVVMWGGSSWSGAAATFSDYKDVPDGSWYFRAVKYVTEEGIFNGMSPTSFGPHTPMTRSMFVQTLANYTVNFRPETIGSSHFRDVDLNTWYGAAVNWAYEQNLLSGVREGYFDPGGIITREQAARILHTYTMRIGKHASIQGAYNQNFIDSNQVSSWADAAMAWALENQIITGMNQQLLSPKGALTRAQAAQLFLNMEPITGRQPEIFKRGDIGQDPDLAFLRALNVTYQELVRNTENPKPYNPLDGYQSGFFYEFDDYPEGKYLFSALGDINMNTGYPNLNAMPTAVFTRVDAVMPELSGIRFGEAVAMTEGKLEISFDQYHRPYFWFRARYQTESYLFQFFLTGSDYIDGSSQVMVMRRR